MLYGKIFRSTVAHGRIKSIDTSARARRCPASTASSPSTTSRKVIPDPYYGPAFHDQPILADRQGALRRRAGRGGARRRSARRREAAQLIAAEYEELPAVFDEVEAMTSKALRARRAQARRHLRRPQASQGRARTPMSRSTSSCAAATSTRPSPRPRTCSSTRSAPRRCCTCRSSRSSRSPTDRTTGVTHPHRLAGPVVRAHRDRAAARLAGEHACASRCRISAAASAPSSTSSSKRWSLALSLIARRPVKIALTMEEQFYTITKHPSTFRIKSGVDKDGTHHRAQVRGVGGTAAPMPTSARASRRSRASPRPAPTTSTTSRSIPTRSTPT